MNPAGVKSISVSGAKFQISSSGGSEPQRRNDGTELFYLAVDGSLKAVPLKSGRPPAGSFQAGLRVSRCGTLCLPRYVVSAQRRRQ